MLLFRILKESNYNLRFGYSIIVLLCLTLLSQLTHKNLVGLKTVLHIVYGPVY